MSEKMTRILLRGSRSSGLMEWGELSAEQMIAQYRDYAAHLRKQAEDIEAAADFDFAIDIVRGPHVQRHVRTVQQGRPK